MREQIELDVETKLSGRATFRLPNVFDLLFSLTNDKLIIFASSDITKNR